MIIEEARKLIPPGFVECDEETYGAARSLIWSLGGYDWTVYAIPAPKPEPRRVPMGEMVAEFGGDGCCRYYDHVERLRRTLGGYDAVAYTKWRLDPDTREWVEEVE